MYIQMMKKSKIFDLHNERIFKNVTHRRTTKIY